MTSIITEALFSNFMAFVEQQLVGKYARDHVRKFNNIFNKNQNQGIINIYNDFQSKGIIHIHHILYNYARFSMQAEELNFLQADK